MSRDSWTRAPTSWNQRPAGSGYSDRKVRRRSDRQPLQFQPTGRFEGSLARSILSSEHETNVTVTIASLAGEALLGPEEMLLSSPIASMKGRLKRSRPGKSVRILHGTRELMDSDTLKACTLISNEQLNLVAVMSKTYAVVAWGERAYGGSTEPALEDGVLELFSSSGAFAAIKDGGSVIAWGHPAYGGDVGNAARHLTSDVVSICSGQNAFVALKRSGAAVAWGNAKFGGKVTGDASRKLANGITSVKSSGEAFAALTGASGEVVTWGQGPSGGDSSSVAHLLASGVKELYATRGAFAALKHDGSVVTWGIPHSGGDSSIVSDQLANNVVQVYSNTACFVALKVGGGVVAWGNPRCGGHLGSSAEKLRNDVIAIYCSGAAFAALKSDGALISWGMPGEPIIAAELLARGGGATKTNTMAVATVLETGEVVTRGDARGGGDCSSVASQLRSGVIELASTQGAFAALKDDGSVVAWGRSEPVNLGGDSSSVASSLERGVLALRSTQSAFAVLKDISK